MQQRPCGPTRALLKRKRYLPAAPENRSLAILYIALHSLPSSSNSYLAKRRVLRNSNQSLVFDDTIHDAYSTRHQCAVYIPGLGKRIESGSSVSF
jgi:hypothetical protein